MGSCLEISKLSVSRTKRLVCTHISCCCCAAQVRHILGWNPTSRNLASFSPRAWTADAVACGELNGVQATAPPSGHIDTQNIWTARDTRQAYMCARIEIRMDMHHIHACIGCIADRPPKVNSNPAKQRDTTRIQNLSSHISTAALLYHYAQIQTLPVYAVRYRPCRRNLMARVQKPIKKDRV